MKNRICIMGLTLILAIFGIMGVTRMFSNYNKNIPVVLTYEEISWNEFYKAHGYDTNTNDEIINESLDTWVTSIEEERVFNNFPAQET